MKVPIFLGLILIVLLIVTRVTRFKQKPEPETVSYIPQYLKSIPASAFSACGRCETSWKYTEGHTTYYSETSGMFPLCESCWQQLTPSERLPYYKKLYNDWKRMGDTVVSWENIEKAVLAGN